MQLQLLQFIRNLEDFETAYCRYRFLEVQAEKRKLTLSQKWDLKIDKQHAEELEKEIKRYIVSVVQEDEAERSQPVKSRLKKVK